MRPHNQTAFFSVRQLAAVMCDRDAIVCGIFGLTGLLLMGLTIYFGVVPGTDEMVGRIARAVGTSAID